MAGLNRLKELHEWRLWLRLQSVQIRRYYQSKAWLESELLSHGPGRVLVTHFLRIEVFEEGLEWIMT